MVADELRAGSAAKAKLETPFSATGQVSKAPVVPQSAPAPVSPPVRSTGLAALATPAPPTQPAASPMSAPAADLTRIPTPEEIFGESPFMANPQGQFIDANTGELRKYGFRPMYFATASAAQKVAQQLGGTVVTRNAICNAGFFTQVQPNYMIQLPNGVEVNAGIVADFYNHGYPQSYIDRLIAREIDPNAGYDNLAVPVTTVKNGVVQPGAYSTSYAPKEIS
jgi:hypothetical protein